MPQIKRILFPVDFSESCCGAARYVEAFAGHFEAEIVLVHAVGNGEHTVAEELLPGRSKQLSAFLATELKYFTTRREIGTGDPLDVIFAAAQSSNPDLIMLPTHGLGYFRRHLLGSVTAKVLHDFQCPVWTSVHAETAPALEDLHLRRILCSVDLTASSRKILEWAGWMAGEFGADLGIIHVTADIAGAAAGWLPGDELQRHILEGAGIRIDALQRPARRRKCSSRQESLIRRSPAPPANSTPIC